MKFQLIHIDGLNRVELKWILLKDNNITGSFHLQLNSDPPADEFTQRLRDFKFRCCNYY